MHLFKRNPKIPIGICLVWLVLFLSINPCSRSNFPQILWSVTFTSLVFILAWSNSRALLIDPTSSKNVAILFFRAIYEALLCTFVFVVLYIPIMIFTPAYQCYTERAFTSEILAVVSSAQDKVGRLIKESGSVVNDYKKIDPPEHERIDYFQVTSEGIILVHSIEPDFTIYLTPSIKSNEVQWVCKAYPPKISPASCR